MPSVHSAHRAVRTGEQVLFAFSIAIGLQSINAATAANTAGLSQMPQRLVKVEGAGSVTVVPGTDSPHGCLAAGKGVCSAKFAGTGTSTLFSGVGQLSGSFTLDYTKAQISAIGSCFPELVIGAWHSSRGSYNIVEQGPLCVPPASTGLRAGFTLQSRAGLLTGGTGAFKHIFGTMQVSVSSNPSGQIIFTDNGAASGVEGGGA